MNTPNAPDPRVFFAAERTLLAWQRSSLALMAFGFVIERFSLFLAAIQPGSQNPARHHFSLLMGLILILLGAVVSVASIVAFRRFVRNLPPDDIPCGHWAGLGIGVNLVIAAIGVTLSAYLLLTAL